jgi:excisionase family DNA binding protein
LRVKNDFTIKNQASVIMKTATENKRIKLNLKELLARGALIKPEELAQAMNVSPGTIYMWITRGTIPHLAFGKSKRFDPEEIAEWIRGHRVGAKKDPGAGHTVATI